MFPKIFALLFILGVSLPGILSITEAPESRQIRIKKERRKLAEFPSISGFFADPTKFPKAFDKFAEDNFGFRSLFVDLQSGFRYGVFGDPPTDRYLRGREGWFFRASGREKNNTDGGFNDLRDFTGATPFSERSLQIWEKDLVRRAKLAESLGAKYLFGVAPRKTTVYPEHLPFSISSSPGVTRREQLTLRGKNAIGPKMVDLLPDLLEEKSWQPLYYKTDAHWNYAGAYVAYRTFIEAYNRTGGSIVPVPKEGFQISELAGWHHDGFLAETRLLISEPFYLFKPTVGGPYEKVRVTKAEGTVVEEGNDLTTSSESAFLTQVGIGHADMPNVRVRTLGDKGHRQCRILENLGSPPLGTLVLIGDSFIQKSAAYFSAHFRRVYFCRQTDRFRPPVFDLDRNEPIEPELIIQEILETYMGRRQATERR